MHACKLKLGSQSLTESGRAYIFGSSVTETGIEFVEQVV